MIEGFSEELKKQWMNFRAKKSPESHSNESNEAQKPQSNIEKPNSDPEEKRHRDDEDDKRLEEIRKSLKSETFHKKDPFVELEEDKYRVLNDFMFKTYERVGVEAKHIKSDPNGREIYPRPTEPYDLKKKFLLKNGIQHAKNIFTVLGANWPVFYADIMGDDVRMLAVDENKKQAQFLNEFLTDEEEFGKMFAKNDVDFRFASGVPYYPFNENSVRKPTLAEKMKNPKVVRRLSAERDYIAKGHKKLKDLREKMSTIIRRDRFDMVISDIRDAVSDIDMSGIDYVDLSNIPEILGVDQTQKIIEKFPPNTLAYMAFLKIDKEEESDFLAGLTGVEVVDKERASNFELDGLKWPCFTLIRKK